jgi:hypothetical protein
VAVALVHPYFKASNLGDGISITERPVEDAHKQTSNFLKNATDKGPPIFLFQGGEDWDDAQKKAQKYLADAGSTIYVVATYPASPEPRFHSETIDNLSKISKIHQSEHWQGLANRMEDVGVKKLVVGGIYFGVSQRPEQDTVGCVNSFIAHMEKSFQIKLSNFTWPSNRRTVERLKKGQYDQFL